MLQRLGAIQERCRGRIKRVAASWSIAGALLRSSSCSVQERRRSVRMGVAAAFRDSRSSSCSVQEHRWGVLWLGSRLQRPGALQRPGTCSCSIWEHCRSVAATRNGDRSRIGTSCRHHEVPKSRSPKLHRKGPKRGLGPKQCVTEPLRRQD